MSVNPVNKKLKEDPRLTETPPQVLDTFVTMLAEMMNQNAILGRWAAFISKMFGMKRLPSEWHNIVDDYLIQTNIFATAHTN